MAGTGFTEANEGTRQEQRFMRKLIFAAMFVACASGGFAQGTVVFANHATGSINTRVYFGGTSQIIANGTDEYSDSTMTPGTFNWSSYAPLQGTQYLAQLLAAPGSNLPEQALVPATPVTTFRTSTAGTGFINNTTATLFNVPLDAPVATIEMVVWDNSSSLYPTWTQARVAWSSGLIFVGESGTFNLQNIGGTQPAPYLYGLRSFNLYNPDPEPSSSALMVVGGLLLWSVRRICRR